MNEIKKIFSLHIRNLKIIVKENINHSNIVINNAKIERFRKKIQEIAPFVTKIKKEKSKNFQLKKLKTMKTMNLITH